MTTWLCWNGTCFPGDRPLIGGDDRSFLAGEGAFETMRAIQGRVPALTWHLARLHATLAWLGWPESASQRLDTATVTAALSDLLARQGLSDARVRLTVSRSGSDRDVTLNWLLQALPDQGPTELQRQQGVSVITVPDVPHPRLPHKLTSRAAYGLVDRTAREAGAYEGLFCEDGIWLEGSRTNLLAVRGDDVIVGDARIVLPGIARRAVMAGAPRVGLHLRHTGIDRWDRTGFDALFLTNSLIGVLPVSRVDDGDLRLRPELCERLQEAYRLGMSAV